jgi:hypothetical protein
MSLEVNKLSEIRPSHALVYENLGKLYLALGVLDKS